MFHLIFAALAGTSLSAAICLILWKLRMRKLAAAPEVPPPTELTEWDRRTMAYHEAGHAVCSRYLPEREPLVRITISPSDEAFGMVRTAPRPHHNETRVSFASTMAVMLAGRLAEEMFLNEVTTSCVHDLAAARQIAADMVTHFGMGSRTGFALPPPDFPMSDERLSTINADIGQLLADAEAEAREVLSERRQTVKELAERLLCEDTLDADGIEEVFDRDR